MNKASLYLRHSRQAQRDAVYVLNKYFKLLAPIESGTVLDVGCGPGNVTTKELLPLLPKTTKKIVGIDFSEEIIDYARNHFLTDPRLSFRRMDIVSDDIPSEYLEAFDFIFSHYCLHFVADKKKAAENIYKMLKPGGDILLSFMSNSDLFEAYRAMHGTKKWKPYMENLPKILQEETGSPKEHLEAVLTDVGFKVHTCTVEDKKFSHNVENCLELITAISLFDVPVEKKEEFALDCLEFIKRRNLNCFDKEGKRIIDLPYSLIVCHARKNVF